MASRSFERPLPTRDLRWHCAPSRFKWATTADATPLLETIGQKDALEALRLGVELYAPGYNVYVAGLPGVGKSSLALGLLEEMAPRCAMPADRVYVNNFRHPERPTLIELPRGDGKAFSAQVDKARVFVADGIRRLADDEAYARRREEIDGKLHDAERQAIDAFERACRERGFTPAAPAGGGAEPDLRYTAGTQTVAMGDLDDAVRSGLVPAEKEPQVRAAYRELRTLLAATLRKVRLLAQERRKDLDKLEREVSLRIFHESIADLRTRFPSPAVAKHLEEAQAHFVERFPFYARVLLESGEGKDDGSAQAAEDAFREFGVNLLLDTTAIKSCPVVMERQPTWANLFGQVERDVDARGNARVDHMQVRAGSLLRADGGYLVLQAADVLHEEGVWTELKRVLKSGRLEIRTPEALAASSPILLRPDPIPVNVKVVLIGDESTWYELREEDEDFSETFKVRATFERHTPLTEAALHHYASFFHRLSKEEGLLHLDPTGLAVVAEEGVREAGRRGKLSVRFGRMSDLVREADHAAREHGAQRISATHVREALAASRRRAGVEERRMGEAVQDGMILVQTAGARVGQVNGLAVYDFGDHRFGKAARISAAVGAGRIGVVNVERLSALSGSSHDKGVLILSGWLRATFAAERPAAFTASIVFEQSYGGVEGDSATCAEAVAIVSALAGLPVRQDLAITGSMNQLGDVQPVGGLNDKVEGFYDLCCRRGLTGTQGVVVPRANVEDLMLREDVVAACARKEFAVYAVDRIEQGIRLLTGSTAEEVTRLVDARLDRLAAAARALTGGSGL